MDDLQQVLVSLDEIEMILKRHNYPEPNPKALSRIRFLAVQMSGRDSYISEKASRLAELSGVFYSQQRHARHPGGVSSLLTEISYDLPSRIRAQITHLQRIQKERSDLSDA